MARIDSKLAALRKRAAKGALEVEHLTDLAVLGDPAAAPVIRELQAQYNWPRTNRIDGELYVPLGRWADVVCDYLEGGCDALIAYARLPAEGSAHFAIAVLGELKSAASVRAMVELVKDYEEVFRHKSDDCRALVDAINRALSFKDRPFVLEADDVALREFLHELLRANREVVETALVVCALRGVGDEESIRLISDLPPFEEPWARLEILASSAIRKRLKRLPPGE